MSRKLLEGIKVVELATFIAAGTTGRFLSDMGADVIKIEAANGDPVRYTAPAEGRPLDLAENPTWELENSGKRGLSVDTRKPEGKEILFKLLDSADIFLTNWREQALAKNGLDYESLKKRYPSLVYGIVTGYGQVGPDKDLPGFDFTAFFARGGYLDMLRQADGRPMNVLPGTGDHNVGMNLAAGILAALYHAKMTGEGEKVESSLFETAVFNLAMPIQASQYPETCPNWPVNARDGASPLNNAFLTKDNRYIMLCFPNYGTYYNKLVGDVFGRADLVNNERYYPVENLAKNGTGREMYDIACAEFMKKDFAEFDALLKAADIPFGLAQNGREILQDAQAWANGSLCEFTYPSGMKRTLVRQPVRFQELGPIEYKFGPKIGEHSREILQEYGYTQEQIDALYSSKVIYTQK